MNATCMPIFFRLLRLEKFPRNKFFINGVLFRVRQIPSTIPFSASRHTAPDRVCSRMEFSFSVVPIETRDRHAYSFAVARWIFYSGGARYIYIYRCIDTYILRLATTKLKFAETDMNYYRGIDWFGLWYRVVLAHHVQLCRGSAIDWRAHVTFTINNACYEYVVIAWFPCWRTATDRFRHRGNRGVKWKPCEYILIKPLPSLVAFVNLISENISQTPVSLL